METHDKIWESLDNVSRLRVGKGERTAAYTGRCRELFEKAAREGIGLPDVARGYLMLRGARLGPERKAIVLAAAGQSYTEPNVAQALRSTFPINLGVTKEFVHVMDDGDEPLVPLEEHSVQLRDTEQHDRGVVSDRGRRGSPNFGHLEGVSSEPEHGQARPQFQPEFQFTDASTKYRADPPKDEMLPLSSHWTLQQGLP